MKAKFYNRRMLIGLLLCLLPIVFYLPFYGILPESMPCHFDSRGVADGYIPKFAAVFLVPLGLAALYLFTLYITYNDPKQKNNVLVVKKLFTWIIPTISLLVNLAILLYALGKPVQISMFTGVLVGVLLIVVGNYLPKCRQNYTVGIKLPWTLSSQENWDKTHRVGAWCFIAAGLLLVLASVFGLNRVVIVGSILVCVLVPAIYSFILFKNGI